MHGEFRQAASKHIRGNCCPRCTNKFSKPHQKVVNYLLNLGYIENIDFEIDNRKEIRNPITNRPLELDIYFPAKRIAIEIDGVYYHPEDYSDIAKHSSVRKRVALEKTYMRSMMKPSLCEERSIKLLTFTDTEINEEWDRVIEEINLNLDH